MVAFVSERDGNSEIYVINVDGTGLLRLTDHAGVDADPAWSPDGKQIVFVSDRGGSGADLYTMDADGSNVVRRTEQGSTTAPSWSPDGKTIAFSSLRGGQYGIYVTAVDGDWANPTRVGYDRGWNAHPAWSPDGHRIAFVSDWRAFDFLFDVYVMNADGSQITTLLEGAFFYADGQVYYFQPSWSPDGEKIAAVACSHTRDNCHPDSSIVIVNADGSGRTTLVETGGFARPAWSSDGSRIAYSAQACRECTAELRYMNVDGTGSGVIFWNGHDAAWRP